MDKPLTPDQVNEAAAALFAARQDHVPIAGIPENCRPQSLADAYRIRDRLVELMGERTPGWFCGCTNTVIQEMLGLDEPYYARLLGSHIYTSSAVIDSGNYPPMVFECEFGFVVDRDFGPNDYPVSRASVEAAIVRIHPLVEIVAGHLEDWPRQDVYSVIADNGTDGAWVYGDGIDNWRDLDLVNTPVRLYRNDCLEREGTGANVLGGPLAAFTWMVNALTRDGHTVRAGDFHNSGTATDICAVTSGDRVRVDFGDAGAVQVSLT